MKVVWSIWNKVANPIWFPWAEPTCDNIQFFTLCRLVTSPSLHVHGVLRVIEQVCLHPLVNLKFIKFLNQWETRICVIWPITGCENDNTQGNKHSQLLIKFLSTIISTQSVHNMIITKTTETDSFVTYLVYVSCSCSTNHCEKYCKNNLMVLLLDIWRTKYRYLFPITLENLNVLFIAHHR